MGKFVRAGAGLALAALAGCQSVDTDNIKSFGDAAKIVATAAKDARDIDNKIVSDIAVENQATQFVRGRGPYQFPAKAKQSKVAGKVWDIRIAYAQALADYGAALAASASGVENGDLDKAADNLKAATSSALPGLSARANFGAVYDAAGSVAKTVITQATFERIRAIMVRAHPSIVRGSALLAGDFGEVAGEVGDRYEHWKIAKSSALDAIRVSSSGSEKYQAYRSFLQDEKDMKASVALLVATDGNSEPGYKAILDKMVKAHAALIATNTDQSTIAVFAAAAQQFKALSDALHKDQDQ